MALDKETINCWKINYGLDDKTPGEAANWWSDRLDGKAPAGAVAALGVALDEIARVTAERDEMAAKLAAVKAAWGTGRTVRLVQDAIGWKRILQEPDAAEIDRALAGVEVPAVKEGE
jgi:hypothetical protein